MQFNLKVGEAAYLCNGLRNDVCKIMYTNGNQDNDAFKLQAICTDIRLYPAMIVMQIKTKAALKILIQVEVKKMPIFYAIPYWKQLPQDKTSVQYRRSYVCWCPREADAYENICSLSMRAAGVG